jgi:hypothetical protein
MAFDMRKFGELADKMDARTARTRGLMFRLLFAVLAAGVIMAATWRQWAVHPLDRLYLSAMTALILGALWHVAQMAWFCFDTGRYARLLRHYQKTGDAAALTAYMKKHPLKKP